MPRHVVVSKIEQDKLVVTQANRLIEASDTMTLESISVDPSQTPAATSGAVWRRSCQHTLPVGPHLWRCCDSIGSRPFASVNQKGLAVAG